MVGRRGEEATQYREYRMWMDNMDNPKKHVNNSSGFLWGSIIKYLNDSSNILHYGVEGSARAI